MDKSTQHRIFSITDCCTHFCSSVFGAEEDKDISCQITITKKLDKNIYEHKHISNPDQKQQLCEVYCQQQRTIGN